MLRFIIAEDHPLLRGTYKEILLRHFEDCTVSEVSDGEELVAAFEAEAFDLALVDIKMKRMSGTDATRLITKANNGACILAVSTYEDEAHIAFMFEAGARGYLTKGCSEEELLEAVHTLLKGRYFISGRVMNEKQLEQIIEWRTHSGNAITEREKEVLELLCKGLTNKEIAAKLNLSVKTVENHRTHLHAKTGTNTAVELMLFAQGRGWVQ